MRDTADVDLAVAGGGVAGSAVCVAAARHGLRVVWLAPPAHRTAEPYGESLAPASRPILSALGLEAALHDPAHRPARSTFAAWAGPQLVERHAAVHLEGPGWVLDRAVFERHLAAAAARHATRMPVTVRQASVQAGGWRVVLSDGAEVTARFLVDATGRAAVLARRQARLRRHDRLIAALASLPQRTSTVTPTPATLIEAVEDGWRYAALLPDGRLSVAAFTDPQLRPARSADRREQWARLLPDGGWVRRWIEEAEFTFVSGPRWVNAGVVSADPPAHPDHDGAGSAGWAAVGDAAAALDPLSSHGMTSALWSGAQVGAASAAWLAGDHRPLARYRTAVRDGVDRFLAARRVLYAQPTRFADAPFWHARR